MSCKLNKFQTYDVGQVHHDLGTGSYAVKLLNPGPLCPDGTFNSKKAKLVVNAGSSPSLGFSLTDNKPVITVPSNGFVIEYGSSFGFGSTLLVIGGVVVLFFIGRAVYRRLVADTEENLEHNQYPATASGPRYLPQSAPVQSSAGGGATVVNTGPDILTTVLLADMLSDHHHGGYSGSNSDSHNTTINNYNNDSNSSSDDTISSDSSDDDNNYSSDSSDDSSYSSDSSSDDSFSSDSSDSGSSFGSDD